MPIGKISYLLAQGFIIGYGPCLAICIPILLPYIAGTRRTWQEGLVSTIYFSLTRLIVYILLGGVSGYVGAFLISFYYYNSLSYYIWSAGAGMLMLVGVLIILGKNMDFGVCHVVSRRLLMDRPTSGMIVLGLLVGFSPCLPLIGILLEIALLAHNFAIGAMYGLFFGIGTVLSPLLLVGALAPVIGGSLYARPVIYRLFTLLCGFTMIGLGLYVVFFRGIV